MKAEVEWDIECDKLRYSKDLNHSGTREFSELLMRAVDVGDESSLAFDLKERQCIRVYDAISDGKNVSLVKVPENRCHELSKSEFNKFYLRGLCRQAVDEGLSKIVVFDESVERVYSSSKLLSDLRADMDIEDIMGVRKSEKRVFNVEMK